MSRVDEYRQALTRLDVLRQALTFKPEFADDKLLEAALDLVLGMPIGVLMGAMEKADKQSGTMALIADALPEHEMVKTLREGLSDG